MSRFMSEGDNTSMKSKSRSASKPRRPDLYVPIPHRIFVGGLPSTTTIDELTSFFLPYGAVKDVKLFAGRANRSYGFVTFTSAETTNRLLRKNQPIFFKSFRVNIAPAYRKPSKRQQETNSCEAPYQTVSASQPVLPYSHPSTFIPPNTHVKQGVFHNNSWPVHVPPNICYPCPETSFFEYTSLYPPAGIVYPPEQLYSTVEISSPLNMYGVYTEPTVNPGSTVASPIAPMPMLVPVVYYLSPAPQMSFPMAADVQNISSNSSRRPGTGIMPDPIQQKVESPAGFFTTSTLDVTGGRENIINVASTPIVANTTWRTSFIPNSSMETSTLSHTSTSDIISDYSSGVMNRAYDQLESDLSDLKLQCNTSILTDRSSPIDSGDFGSKCYQQTVTSPQRGFIPVRMTEGSYCATTK